MKRMHFSYFGALSLVLMLASVAVSLARAPATAKIVFSSNRDGAWDIYLMNPDGTEPEGLTHLDGNNYHPTWSPTGRHILFTSDRDGFLDLYLMNADGRNTRRVFRQWDVRQHPTWAPDGKRIAYVRGSLNQKDKKVTRLYIAAIEGAREEPLADGSFPTWSPGGTEIAFVGANGEIRAINVETQVEEVIAPMKGAVAMDLAWSPDGTQLAFTRLELFDFIADKAEEARDALKAGDKQGVVIKGEGKPVDIQTTIYSINRDGNGLKQIVALDGTKTSEPTWSPRGDDLIYHQLVGNELQLFKVALGGGVVEQLTFEGSNFDADWFDPAALPVAPQPRLLTTTWGKAKSSKPMPRP